MQRFKRWQWLSLSGLALAAAIAVLLVFQARPATRSVVADEVTKSESAPGKQAVRVDVTHPTLGGIERQSVRPGSVIAFESADLYAKISGYLQTQNVDIGSRVKASEVLVFIDAPEFNKQAEQAQAGVDQAEAQRTQAEARIVTAEAERDAAKAYVEQTKAEVDRAIAVRKFRVKQHDRIAELFKKDSIDARLVDEKLNEMESSLAAEAAARAGVITAQAKVSAAEANVSQARADLISAQANVEVAKAAWDKAAVFVDYTKIVSPYDGVVTKRNFSRGAFIRAAEQGGLVPLLAVSRQDLMRVVAQVPDRDVPYVSVGNPVKVEIDALPGEDFPAKISRVADSEDPETRTMRIEIDLPNPDGRLREGMYGSATISLNQGKKTLTVPSSSLVGNVNNGKTAVYVVDEGAARSRAVSIGADNGVTTEVLRGLSEGDEVITRHSGPLADGAAVEVVSRANAR